jgi:hypothetical protein
MRPSHKVGTMTDCSDNDATSLPNSRSVPGLSTHQRGSDLSGRPLSVLVIISLARHGTCGSTAKRPWYLRSVCSALRELRATAWSIVNQYPTIPKVEYSLTKMGESFREPVNSFKGRRKPPQNRKAARASRCRQSCRSPGGGASAE